ncbi:MAG TPA: beta-aspartyl-peptidase [Crocinitomicaceae bacterium]|nr:beta-aspartyl-peptidase [Crocinitomicaceae bacterium]
MKFPPLLLLLLMLNSHNILIAQKNNPTNFVSNRKIAIAIHGGAGNIKKRNLTPEQESAYLGVLDNALLSGYKALQEGKSSVDVVEIVIRLLEDSPLFNAGKGSVFSNEGKNEMDAAIMDGKTLHCGAVTNLTHVKNPISLAKAIMLDSQYVFLNGAGAEKFAKLKGIELVDTSYFFDQKRWNEMLKLRDTTKTILDNDRGQIEEKESISKFGTVGCVILDMYGNLAAGTSTGGITNKRYNRIGDSPVIGSGTYANNKTCAISCTGHGEDFMRIVAAHQVHSYMFFSKMSLRKSAENVIMKELTQLGGRGGLIGVDRKGNITFQFNTNGMFRAGINCKGEKTLSIYK